MSDVERLLRSFDSGALLPPSADVPNTVDLSLAIASVCGAQGVDLTSGGGKIADEIAADHLVFALIDGLGMNLIEAQPAEAFLRSHSVKELRSVFPSTTATALTSLATGLWPAQHAIPGWWTHLPEQALTATVLPFIERFTERPLTELGVDPASVYVAPALAPRFARNTCSFLPEQIADSVYTNYTTGSSAATGYAELPTAIDAIIARIKKASAPTYTYLYFPVIDTLQHAVGPDAKQVRSALYALDRQFARLAAGLGKRGRLAVSADHGLASVEKSGKHLLPADVQELLLVPPSGEPRVPYFHVKPGRQGEFADRFRERLGGQFALLTIDEAEQLELFGPEKLAAATQGRIGDFVGIAVGQDVLLSAEVEFRGYHGALSPDEMRIPLIVT